jgi:hypothetical protein
MTISVEKLFKDIKIEFKLLDSESIYKVYKIGEKKNLLVINNKNNQFKLSRDWFDYLDFNSLPYSILLLSQFNDEMYYLELNKEHNWVKSCFESCDKEEIFLGKQVLNYRPNHMLLLIS